MRPTAPAEALRPPESLGAVEQRLAAIERQLRETRDTAARSPRATTASNLTDHRAERRAAICESKPLIRPRAHQKRVKRAPLRVFADALADAPNHVYADPMFEKLRAWLLPRPPIATPVDMPPAEVRPAWAGEILESLQKQTRSAAKQTARLEGLLGESSAQLQETHALVQALHESPAQREAAQLVPEELFDALDALDEAATFVQEPNLSEGLQRVHARIASYCARLGYARLAAVGGEVDARTMRVVGAQTSPALPPGAIVRVVRAAIVAGNALVREGQVIVNRMPNEEAVQDESYVGN
jgi:molecular chaperone GrpE (heat shock protein)